VWRWGGADEGEVYLQSLVDGSTTLLFDSSPGFHSAGYPDVWGSDVAWIERLYSSGDVFEYDTMTAQKRQLTSSGTAQAQFGLAVWDGYVVWSDFRHHVGGETDIFWWDPVMGRENRLTLEAANQLQPDIDQWVIVWTDERFGNRDIYAYDMLRDHELRITDEVEDQYHPAIEGHTVVWTDERHGGRDIYAYDLRTGTETRVTSDPGDQFQPAVDGDIVVWTDGRNHTSPKSDLYAYDLSAGSETRLTDESAFQADPAVLGRSFFWSDDRLGVGQSKFVEIFQGRSAMEARRSAGADRYATSVATSRDHFARAHSVIIATGADFADALAASGLAGAYEAPVLLTPPDMLRADTRAEIERLGPTTAIIVGGPGAVSPAVETALETFVPVVERLGGTDRYDTAKYVAYRVHDVTNVGPNVSGFSQAFVVRGDAFPDALSVGPVAYHRKVPVLLTPPTSLSPGAHDALDFLSIREAVIVGGEGAVSGGVQSEVDAVLVANGGDPSDRWAGDTRYDTAVRVAEEATRLNWASPGYVGLATGMDFPDALGGAAACGSEYGLILLTTDDTLPWSVDGFLAANSAAVARVGVFGGDAVVSGAVAEAAEAAADR
jgi:beta propeller repeat protein